MEQNRVRKSFIFDLQAFNGGEGDNPPAGNPPATAPPANEPAGDDLSKKSAEELAEYARDLRKREAAARKKYDDAEKSRAELAKWREERENAELAEQKKFQELADKERKAREKHEADSAVKLKEKDARYIRAEVRAAAIRAGIHDPKDVNNFDISDLRLDDNDEVAGIDDFVAAQKAAKPHWFKQAEGAPPKPGGTPPPPRGKEGKNESTDWNTVSSDELQKEISRLLTAR
jgi:flagellar biosynthesis GTPase FlhF